MVVTDPFALLNGEVGSRGLHEQLKKIYEDNQVPNLRRHIHLSDLTRPVKYRGNPAYCARKIILSAHFEPVEIKHPHPRVAIFERGTDMHLRWQEKFRRSGKVVSLSGIEGIEATHELQFLFHGRPLNDDDWRLLFTPDLIVDLGRGPEIIELKGYGTRTFNPLFKNKDVPADQLPGLTDALFQVNAYMAFSGVLQATIIVECKDTQSFWQWRVKFNPALLQPLENRIIEVDAFDQEFRTNQGRLPARVCASSDDDLAKECSQKHTCFLANSLQRQPYMMRLVKR